MSNALIDCLILIFVYMPIILAILTLACYVAIKFDGKTKLFGLFVLASLATPFAVMAYELNDSINQQQTNMRVEHQMTQSTKPSKLITDAEINALRINHDNY